MSFNVNFEGDNSFFLQTLLNDTKMVEIQKKVLNQIQKMLIMFMDYIYLAVRKLTK